jgi:rhodanese-related sulfurtransferase
MSQELKSLSPESIYALQQQGKTVQVVDVRTPAEFDAVHAVGAQLFPLERFDAAGVVQALGGNGTGTHDPIIVTCTSGGRAREAALRLLAAGYSNVHIMEGGTRRWSRVGLPVVRGKPHLPLERQVQIAIGALVVLKVVFGYAFHPLFFVLVGAVGAGLVLAGITGNCALTRVIAKLPWNQSVSCETAGSTA